MAEFDTTRDFHDELLSAFLDGELSPDERARVEERLVLDPVARQMLDELRSVSQAVRELPHESLGEDLRASVLERAQQALAASVVLPLAQLPESNGSPRAASPAEPAEAQADIVPLKFSIGRTRRGWIWAAMATAAAIAIMVVGREQVPDANSNRQSASRELAQNAAEGRKRTSDELDSSAARTERDIDSDGAAGNEFDTDAFAQDLRLKSAARARDAAAEPPAATKPDNQGLGAPFESGRAGQLVKQEELGAGGQPARGQLTAAAETSDAKPASIPALPTKAEGTTRSGERPLLADAGGRGEVTSRGATMDYAELSRGAVDQTKADQPASLSGRAVGVSGPVSAMAGAEAGPATGDLLVVCLDVPREVIQSRGFDRQLREHGISIEPSVEREAAGEGAALGLQFKQRVLQELSKLPAPALPAAGDVDVVLVDASPVQIAGLLGDLDRDADKYLDISLANHDIARDKEQQAEKLAAIDWDTLRRASSLPEELRKELALATAAEQQSTNGVSANSPSASGIDAAQPGAARRGGRGGAAGGRGGGGVARGGGGGGRGGGVLGGAPATQSGSGATPTNAEPASGNSQTPPGAPAGGEVAGAGRSTEGQLGQQVQPGQQGRPASDQLVDDSGRFGGGGPAAGGGGRGRAGRGAGRGGRRGAAPPAPVAEPQPGGIATRYAVSPDDLFQTNQYSFQVQQSDGRLGGNLSTVETKDNAKPAANQSIGGRALETPADQSERQPAPVQPTTAPVPEQQLPAEKQLNESSAPESVRAAGQLERGRGISSEGGRESEVNAAEDNRRQLYRLRANGRQSVQVLFVLRAKAEPNAAGAISAVPATPPTSLPAEDRGK